MRIFLAVDIFQASLLGGTDVDLGMKTEEEINFIQSIATPSQLNFFGTLLVGRSDSVLVLNTIVSITLNQNI